MGIIKTGKQENKKQKDKEIKKQTNKKIKMATFLPRKWGASAL
ncbi:MAG: hypothetical protein ACP5PO_03315 [Desulfurella sp.]